MKKVKIYLFVITIVILVLLSQTSRAQSQPVSPSVKLVVSPCLFKADLRKLWYDHALWTRNVILTVVDELPGGEQAYIRLLENQDDLGNAFKPYFGEATGNKLSSLLKAHISLTNEVVRAIKDTTTSQLDNATKRWYANGEEIVTLLSAKGDSSHEELTALMQEHILLTKDVAIQRLKKDYGAEIVSYDKLNNHILMLSDMIAEGIIKQFPEKLKSISSN